MGLKPLCSFSIFFPFAEANGNMVELRLQLAKKAVPLFIKKWQCSYYLQIQ